MKRIYLHVERLRMAGVSHTERRTAVASLEKRLAREFSRPQMLQDLLTRNAEFTTRLGRISAPRMDTADTRQSRSRS